MREQFRKKAADLKGIKAESSERQRRRWNQEQKRQFVEEWKQSGMSRVEFCRRRSLVYGNFLNWIRAVEERQASGFVEVQVRQQGSGNEGGAFNLVELVAPSGWRIRLSESSPLARVREIMELVGRC